MLKNNLEYKYKNPKGEVVSKNASTVINIIKDTILKYVDAKYIYLFGSHAYGSPKDNSDIDICVVTSNNMKDSLELYSNIMLELSKKKIYFVDLLFSREDSFKKKEYLVEKIIHEKGKLLYEQ